MDLVITIVIIVIINAVIVMMMIMLITIMMIHYVVVMMILVYIVNYDAFLFLQTTSSTVTGVSDDHFIAPLHAPTHPTPPPTITLSHPSIPHIYNLKKQI